MFHSFNKSGAYLYVDGSLLRWANNEHLNIAGRVF